MHDTLWTHPPKVATPVAGPQAPLRSPVLPDPTQGWRYAWAYWRRTVPSLLRRHRLHLTPTTPTVADVHVNPALRARWHALFGVHDHEGVPLLYTQGVGTLQYMQLFGQLGINFRHLVHLDHETQHLAGAEHCAAAPHQRLRVLVDDITRAGKDRVVITLRSEIAHAGHGAPLARVIDRFLVRRLPADAVAALPEQGSAPLPARGLSRRQPRLDALANGAWTCLLTVPANWGQRYAAVSGDANPVHTTAWGARLFGQPRAFAQGLSLRNAVAVRLARRGEPLDWLQMTFASPAWLNQTLRLTVVDHRFELVGERGELVAYGRTDRL